jgi:hypothetical protein
MTQLVGRSLPLWSVLAGVFVLAAPSLGRAQGTGGITVADTSVGYIDSAIPGNLLRLRFDAEYDLNRATRAEFFYARTGPSGPGLPLNESRIDDQQLSAYLEVAPAPCWSAFVEVPQRFLNPEINANASGLGDMNAGFKYAFFADDALVTTFQFRTYIPTGDVHLGLGNGHVSLEPALLAYKKLEERLAFEGELRAWLPVGGTDYAGNIIRYGAGLHYDLFRTGSLQFTPVAEVVGWTVLNGQEALFPSGETVDAAGDTIVNVKLGLRTKLGDLGDVYAGYGRALTTDRWYLNTFRVEFRLHF